MGLSAARHNTHLLLLRVLHFYSRYILSGSFGKESKCFLFLCEVVVDKKPLIRMEQAIAGAARIVGAVAEVGKAGTGRGSSENTGIPGGSQSELRPQGLLHQQEEILLGTTATPASSVTPSSLPATTSNATVTPMATTSTPSAVTPTSTPMAASTTSVGAALKDSSSQIPGQVPIVRNLDGTLANCILCREFRDYLILLDSKIPKPKFQVWLDLVLLCQSIFSLPEAEESERRKLMIQVGQVYLAGPPEGHKVALPGAAARRQLEQHCHTLESTEGNSVQADLGLLRKAAFEFVWQKLEEKHDAWRTARAQPTRLQALLCALL